MKSFYKVYLVPSRSNPNKKWKVIHLLTTNQVRCECPHASWSRIRNQKNHCYHELQVLGEIKKGGK